MKTFIRSLAVGVFFLLLGMSTSQAAVVDTTLVSQWGIASYHGSGYHLTANAAGDTANFHGTALQSWESIRGAFYKPIVGNTGTNGAVVVSGKVTFVGAGPTDWSSLRYGVFNNLVPGTLTHAGTDSVVWSGMGTASYGYMFTPQSGTVYVGNIPSGTNASQGVTLGGSWLSTYGGAIGYGGLIQQAPARAAMNPGTYDFAFSIHPQSDGTKLVKFYLVAEGTPVPYWYGGSFIDTTSQMSSDTLNAVCFGIEAGNSPTPPLTMTNMIVTNVHDTLGPDIVVPKAPWQAYYLDQWGFFGGAGSTANSPNNASNRIAGWKFIPGDVIGNAGIGSVNGDSLSSTQWAAIRGGFVQPVTATLDSAIIVTGNIVFTGAGPNWWSALRYGLFMHDSAGTVKVIKDTVGGVAYDSTQWTGLEKYSTGYMFTPHSGVNDEVGWANGGNGNEGVVRNGGTWLSTYGSNVSLGVIDQQPARANADSGTYDFAISVQPLANGTKRVNFYFIREAAPGKSSTYWFGGSLIDTTSIPATFNGVCFALDGGSGGRASGMTGMYLENVKVDLGAPITVPAPPWQNYYVGTWGFYGAQTGGWGLRPGIIGDVNVGGNNPLAGLTAVRGAFFSPVSAINGNDSVLVVTGQVQFVGGGFQTPGSFRLGLFNSANAGKVTVDTSADTSGVWTGTDGQNSGYLFIPGSGMNAPVDWYGHTPGSWGGIMNGVWDSTNSGYVLGNGVLKPAGAVAGPGTYNFEISVAPMGNGTNQVGFELANSDSSYMFGETAMDNHSPVAAAQFNSIMFALNSGTGATAMNLANVQVTMAPSPVVTGVKGASGSEVPKTFALFQNYPNPFNPSTVVAYQLPKASKVVLKVYDVLGREVATLVNGTESAGSYKVTFNMDKYASGVYFVRMSAGSFVHVQKMMLLK